MLEIMLGKRVIEAMYLNRMLAVVALAAVCCMLLATARATDADEPPPPKKASTTLSDWVRSGSLEIPGVTACHQCEWRPKPHQMGAADRCGVDPDGQPKMAEFECGYSEDCKRVCNFTRCMTP